MSPYFALYTVENNKNKKSVKFQGDMLNFCDFIQVFVFTRNHHLKETNLFTKQNRTEHNTTISLRLSQTTNYFYVLIMVSIVLMVDSIFNLLSNK